VAAVPLPPSPASDRPGWDLLFSEDFGRDAALGEFAAVYDGWAQYDGLRDTSRDLGRPTESQGRYSSATTTTVHDGVAEIRVHTAGSAPQVMALTPPAGPSWEEGQRYGRYSVRFRADPVPGYKVAWLLWPAGDDWTEGEIDFPEGDLGGAIDGASHDVTGDPSVNAWSVETGTAMDAWHVATIEWTPSRLTFVLDGRSWTTTDPGAIPTGPMRWVLQTETALTPAPPDPAATGSVLIDWVAAWAYAGPTG